MPIICPYETFKKGTVRVGSGAPISGLKSPSWKGRWGAGKAKGLALAPDLHRFISLFLPLLMSCPLTPNILPLLPTQLRDPGLPRTQWHSRVFVLFQIILLPSSVIMWTCPSDTGSVGVCGGGEGGRLGITAFSNKPGQ